jgi:hypothetical protein
VDDDDFDVAGFALAFETFLHRFNEALPPPSSTLRRLVVEHLGEDPVGLRSSLGANPHLAEQADFDASGQPTPSVVLGWTAFAEPSSVYLPPDDE